MNTPHFQVASLDRIQEKRRINKWEDNLGLIAQSALRNEGTIEGEDEYRTIAA
jgi:hypothetical protein